MVTVRDQDVARELLVHVPAVKNAGFLESGRNVVFFVNYVRREISIEQCTGDSIAGLQEDSLELLPT